MPWPMDLCHPKIYIAFNIAYMDLYRYDIVYKMNFEILKAKFPKIIIQEFEISQNLDDDEMTAICEF